MSQKMICIGKAMAAGAIMGGVISFLILPCYPKKHKKHGKLNCVCHALRAVGDMMQDTADMLHR